MHLSQIAAELQRLQRQLPASRHWIFSRAVQRASNVAKAVRRCRGRNPNPPGDTVAVWGCGPVRLLAMQCTHLLGAERVIAIDRLLERLGVRIPDQGDRGFRSNVTDDSD